VDIPKLAADYGISTDEVRARYLTHKAAQWKQDETGFHLFCRDVIRIRTKTGDLEPLILNEAQNILHDAAETMLDAEGWVRLAGLKGRRQGFSTYVAARGYWRATLWDRQNIYILTHEQKATETLFGMVDLMQQKNPFPPQVGTDNAKTLEFAKRGSSYSVATAGQKAGGRGGAISFFHGSEVAWWPNASDHFSSSVQGVDEVRGEKGVLWRRPANPLPFEMRGPEIIIGWVKPPSEIWLETTSAGPVGEFYNRYMDAMKGKGRYRSVFVPWIVQREYREQGEFYPEPEAEEDGELPEAEYQEMHQLTDSQMLWRRSKIHELGSSGKFRQEYPIDVTEAFASADTDGIFIKAATVMRARKRKVEMPDAPLIIGVDPAGGGGDRFSVAWRRGDLCYKVQARNKLEQEEALAWLSRILDTDKPSRMCIDRGNIGAYLVTALRNMNPKYASIVKGIDFGGTSKAKLSNPKRAGPVNKRAEMWGDMRDWLKEGGAIPDEDSLASDLSAPKEKFRANNDWLLESKVDMKGRGVRSPDEGDSLALTFAVKEFFDTWSKPKVQKSFEAGTLTRVDAAGVGDNDGFYVFSGYDPLEDCDTGWMG
jgi:hypothetical protein